MKIFILAVFLTLPLHAQKDLTGQRYLDWTETAQGYYAMGFLQATIVWAAYEDVRRDDQTLPSSRLISEDLVDCIDGTMSGRQAGAVIKKYIQDRPIRWQDPLPLLAQNAIVKVCADRATFREK
jgi:hypothetical protein